MTKPSINRLIELQHLLVLLQGVDRHTYIPPTTDVPENDIEHSYSLALLAWFLAPHFPDLNQAALLQLALAHDVLEAHSGDTYAYGSSSELSEKADREAAAIKKLEQDWQDFPELLHAIHEYEQRDTNEAKFIYALDKLQPALMGYLNDGRGWRKNGVTFTRFLAEKEKKITAISDEINEYYLQLRTILEQEPNLFAEK